MKPTKGNGRNAGHAAPAKTLTKHAPDFIANPCFLNIGGQSFQIHSRRACDAGMTVAFDVTDILTGHMDGGVKAICRALSRLDKLSQADRQDARIGLAAKLMESLGKTP